MNIKFLKVNEKIENKKELMGFTWISKIVGTYKNYLILQNHQKKKYLYDTTRDYMIPCCQGGPWNHYYQGHTFNFDSSHWDQAIRMERKNRLFEKEDVKRTYTNEELHKNTFKEKSYPWAEKTKNEKWDAQSDYNCGYSIICKVEKDNTLYGVVDTKYNVVFDYDENIKKIKIVSSKYLEVENKERQSNIYKIGEGYLFDFQPHFDEVEHLANNILRAKRGDKYHYINKNKISEKEYDDVVYDKGTIILTDEEGCTFLNTNFKELYKTDTKDYTKSNNFVFTTLDDNKILVHDLNTKKEQIIGKKELYSWEGEKLDLTEYDLEDYEYFYKDEEGRRYLFPTDEYYGIIVEVGDVSVCKWYNNLKTMKENERKLAEAIFQFTMQTIQPETETKKPLAKKKKNNNN